MLLTFESKAGILSMADYVGVKLLKVMGHSGTVPGALLAPELPGAAAKLRDALQSLPATPPSAGETSAEATQLDPSFAKDIKPLIELIDETVKMGSDLTWK
jgi:hypothetical protein